MASYSETASSSHRGYSEVSLQCPRCGGWIGRLSDSNAADTTLVCSDCCFKLTSEHGIWRSLLPERSAHFSHFMKEDQGGKAGMGQDRPNAEYYLALPFCDLSGGNSQQWNQRSRTFCYIVRHVLPSVLPRRGKQLRILDLGAGNGWMSYRLAREGHIPIAVDLLTNDLVGLGAATHYRKHLTELFLRFQADFDTLPFANDEFDLIIYNGSFHYSGNYERTLAEALRCIRADGTILIADTPWYSDEKDGPQMLAERDETYALRYGLPSNALKGLEYLTDERLKRMEASFGIHWQIYTPNYGPRQLMRQALAKLHGTNELSQLRIYSAKAKK
jgi:SAM-dependent methyltransferase/predicted RNA-binding Zn-ribbon protein involved in translation (DUF1610 family)